MSAIIIAGGVSKRFGRDKGLVKLAEKPLVLHVLDKLESVANDVVVVVNSRIQKEKFAKTIKKRARIVIDSKNVQTPLVGALAGFEAVQTDYALLLPCDTPFLFPNLLSFLFEVCVNKAAAIPRWPNGNIEPLHSAYRAKIAAEAARSVLSDQRFDLRAMITEMGNIRYISTIVLRNFDPKLRTFLNINTPGDLSIAENMIRPGSF